MIKTSILSTAVAAFEAFVAKKNRKAVKLGCPEISYTFGETFVQVGDVDGNKYEFIEVFIDESQIKLNGWNIIGRIEDNEGINIVTGFGDLSAFRNADINWCDHCHTRRARKALIIVQNEATGEQKAIGSSCVNDFVGHKSALQYSALVSWVEIVDEIVEEEGWNVGTSSAIVFSTERVLAIAAAIVRECGYTSRAKSEQTGHMPTVEVVKSVLFSKKQIVEVTKSDVEEAKKAVEWFESTTHDDSDYFYNLSKLVNADTIKPRFVGILVSLLPTYHRAIMNRAIKVESNYIGNVGDKKVKFSGKCVKVIGFESFYGYQTMYLIVTPEGNQIKYVTKTNFADEGDEFEFTATIKDHQEYNGTKQTVVTRASRI